MNTNLNINNDISLYHNFNGDMFNHKTKNFQVINPQPLLETFDHKSSLLSLCEVTSGCSLVQPDLYTYPKKVNTIFKFCLNYEGNREINI